MNPVKTFIFALIILSFGCTTNKVNDPVFAVLDREKTGIDFANKITPAPDFNMFTYMYFFNGAGLGAGDFNKDGLIDLFFASNQGQNKLYLNEGGMHFKDVTAKAKLPDDGGWSTGVSVVDINNDGLLDIYVCRVGNYEKLKSKNQLLICQGIDKNGIPYFKDEAAKYGLNFSGFSTQAVFFDYDDDSDLDMFLLNHTVHQNGNFAPRKNFLGTYDSLSGDRIYRNDGGHFTDVTKQTGINSSSIGYGLGIDVSDINLDGYPDIYIGNDFHENDYLYINNKNGTFTDELDEHIMHTSRYSMGVDVADITNDGEPEIISMDMLPSDPYILKRSLGDDTYDLFKFKLKSGYNYQYSRNCLQLNRGNGMFSEIGQYAGVYATDWSWAPLFVDFDNDGWKDLFVSNGIPKRLNDIDYINYVSNSEIQEEIRSGRIQEKDMTLIEKFPQIKLKNKFFKNGGEAKFEDLAGKIEGDLPTYSNGAVYADLDNDGDLDIVVNNINDDALIYENKSNDKKNQSYLSLSLKGPSGNINAIGSKVLVFAKNEIQYYEKYPVHGFLSSMEIPLHIGLQKVQPDSILLIWPDHTYQSVSWLPPHQNIQYKKGLPEFNFKEIKQHSDNTRLSMTDITNKVRLNFKHEEDDFNEFNREPLMPHMLTTEGPALAVADINGDNLDDVFIGSSKWKKSAVFMQQQSGEFLKTDQKALDLDSTFEDIDACWVDVNNDKTPDLVVASGGNEFREESMYMQPRVYLNDGKGNLSKQENSFPDIFVNASCVVQYDFNSDGYADLFIGGRSVPWEYGKIPLSHLLQNNGKGQFIDVTNKVANGLSEIGMVTNAKWCDLDNDGDKDLLITLEWGGIYVFINDKGIFHKKILTDKMGWWNFILPVDIDGDGDLDLIAGNLGLNNRFTSVSEKEPVKMYYADFDGNGKKEQVITYYMQGREIPFANKEELQKQLPTIGKKYFYAENFAKAQLNDIFTSEKLSESNVFTANYFCNALLINNGNFNFTVKPLPRQAQLTSYKTAAVLDANKDGRPDILLGGNFYENNIQMGRYDADFGTILINEGHGNLRCESLEEPVIKGQIRHIEPITIRKNLAFILARNSDSLMVIK
jgi:hypothetical protein